MVIIMATLIITAMIYIFSLSVNLSLATRIRVRRPTAAAMRLKLDDAALSRSNKIDFVSLLQPRQGGAGKLVGGR